MSARLHQDDNWPKAAGISAMVTLPDLQQDAPTLRLVESVPQKAGRTALVSNMRFAAWTAAVCLLTVGPGAFPYEWCRTGGGVLIAALFAGRVVQSVRAGTLLKLFQPRKLWNKLAFAWLAVAALSTAWSYVTGWGAHSPYPTALYNGGPTGPLRLLVDACIAVMGYFAASDSASPPSHLRRLAPVLVASAAVLALAGIEAVRNVVFGANDMRLQATFTNPNLLGAFLCVALPVCTVIAADAGGRLPIRLATGTLAAGLAGALWLSGSRGALLGCMVALGYLAAHWLARRIQSARAADPTTRLRFVPVALALLLIAALPVLARVARRFSTGGISHSVSDDQRQVAWRGATLMIRAHPITGLGMGSYPAALGALQLPQANPDTPSGLPRIPAMHLHAHNFVLEFWAERGLPGLLLAATLVAGALAAAVRSLRQRGSRSSDTLQACACAALLATLTQNIADYTLWYVPVLVLFWQLPALMTAGETADNS